MSELKTLSVKKRTAFGKGANRRLRTEALVPGVYYTADGQNIAVQMAELPLAKIYEQVGRTNVFQLEIEDENGAKTLEWLRRNVEKREKLLRQRNPKMVEPMKRFEEQLRERGVRPENTYLFMHGHTLMDNVVMILLNSVCEKLRAMSIARITASQKQGVALKNEMSNYTNSLRSIRDVLLDNENYTKCPLYKRLQRDIERYIARTILEMKRSGQIKEKSVFGILHRIRQGLE